MNFILALLLLGAEPNEIRFTVDVLLDVGVESGQVCHITPDWKMHRGKDHEDKNCDEYAKVLTGALHEQGYQQYFQYIALCWLMDPCSKGQP